MGHRYQGGLVQRGALEVDVGVVAEVRVRVHGEHVVTCPDHARDGVVPAQRARSPPQALASVLLQVCPSCAYLIPCSCNRQALAERCGAGQALLCLTGAEIAQRQRGQGSDQSNLIRMSLSCALW